MTVKDQLHQLIDDLDETAAIEALDYLRLITNGHPTPVTRPYFANVIDEDDDAEAIIARAKPFSFDDPLWNIVGMIDSGPDGPTDVSANKHKYLAEAYADPHEE